MKVKLLVAFSGTDAKPGDTVDLSQGNAVRAVAAGQAAPAGRPSEVKKLQALVRAYKHGGPVPRPVTARQDQRRTGA